MYTSVHGNNACYESIPSDRTTKNKFEQHAYMCISMQTTTTRRHVDSPWDRAAARRPLLREILHLRNSPLLGYLRMRQVFRRQVFRKG